LLTYVIISGQVIQTNMHTQTTMRLTALPRLTRSCVAKALPWMIKPTKLHERKVVRKGIGILYYNGRSTKILLNSIGKDIAILRLRCFLYDYVYQVRFGNSLALPTLTHMDIFQPPTLPYAHLSQVLCKGLRPPLPLHQSHIGIIIPVHQLRLTGKHRRAT
jgi:hypothetical protein